MNSIVKHALFASLMLNALLGFFFWKVTTKTPSSEVSQSVASGMASDLLHLYTQELDACRDKNSILQDMYCKDLDSKECTAKFDKDAHVVGGAVLSRYMTMKESAIKNSSQSSAKTTESTILGVFEFYKEELGSCINTSFVLEGVYCKGLDQKECKVKYDTQVHAVKKH